jgi:hydroxymethylbilane synthase
VGDRLIRVGTRGSALARAQTERVVQALREAQPAARFDVVSISTSGDRTQHTNAPSGDWGSGVFVKEIEAALLREEIDIAVHSLKDVPPQIPAELTLVAIPVRDDPLDVLVSTAGRALQDLPRGARIGTSSARRVAFLRGVRPDLEYIPIRGNVETRLRKLTDGEYDAIVLARAGLRRLELEPPHAVLDPDLLPPAPGQGALAIEGRAGERETAAVVEVLHDPATGAAVRAERRLMLALDGGCRLPLGALATPRGATRLELLAGVASTDGRQALVEHAEGTIADPEALADMLAARLRQLGADKLMPLQTA